MEIIGDNNIFHALFLLFFFSFKFVIFFKLTNFIIEIIKNIGEIKTIREINKGIIALKICITI